jgi:hypothetical protein
VNQCCFLKFQQFFFAAIIGFALIISFIPFATRAQAAGRQFLRGHVPSQVAQLHLKPIGRLAASEHLDLAIGLPLRNESGLDALLQQIYDPNNPNYRHYLTPEEFAAQFSPTESDYEAVIAFARANGLTITGTYLNRTFLDVNGSVADIERIFHVTMRTYQHPTESRTFYAPDTEPSIDLAVPILHVSGLENFIVPRPAGLKKLSILNKPAGVLPASGSGPGGLLAGNDFRAAYVPGVTLDGSGQAVGLLELDGYYTNDIRLYESSNALPNVTLTNILVDESSAPAGSNNGEVALDIEMVISMAPGLSKVIVYEAPNPASTLNLIHLLTRMATNNLAKQISSSWLIGDDASFDTIYKQFAMQGQSFFQASGDDGAFYPGIGESADDTNITLVGGTTLSTTGPGGAWSSETAWNWYITNPPQTNSSGGGISTTYAIPIWQQGIDMSVNHGSTNMQNIPDVAMNADNISIVADGGQQESVGGTSAAAPLWAAFTALVNQQAVASGRPTVGFINPAVYAIGKSPYYLADFHDITTGNNTNSVVSTNFFAVAGYDLCTGWGTPVGQNLITALATPDALGILPGTGFNATGPAGGPITTTSEDFSLTNSGATSLNWTVAVPSWLTVSCGTGTLAAGGQTTVTVSLNIAVSNLLIEAFSANVGFTNLSSGIVQSRQFTLSAGNGGFETGDFSDWTLTGDGSPDNFVDNGTYITPYSGAYVAALGELGSVAYLSQNLPTTSGQSYLLSLWLDSPNINKKTTPNEFSVLWNGDTLFDQFDIGKIGWTNLQFVVTATSSSTTLQFGGRDDKYYLGLDDVSVISISPPSFQTATQIGNVISFNWSAMTGLVYQLQYKTNLFQSNWINLGGSIMATNLTMTSTDNIGPDPQRFYRLQFLP